MLKPHKTTLNNGLCVLTIEMPNSQGASSIVSVGAGSRYEGKKVNGISHFLEHMVFKGTKKYPRPEDIAQAIEGIGGALNAWTDQDNTNYWNKVPAEKLETGLDVLAQMMTAPLLDKQALEREKGVILQEINRRNDNPADHVWELVNEEMFIDHSLGQTVIGEKETVKSLKREDFQDYMGQHYQAENMVLAVAGGIKHPEVVKLAKKLFGYLRGGKGDEPKLYQEKQGAPRLKIYGKKTDQAHLALGLKGLPYGDKEEAILEILNTILGRGMSSRLFLNIREQKGLAYHIASYTDSFAETGGLFVHAGLETENLELAVREIIKELKRLAEEKVGASELKKAIEQTTGNLRLSFDDSDRVASFYGSQELLWPKTKTIEQTIQELRAVTSEKILNLAKKLVRKDRLSLGVIGPFQAEDEVKLKKLMEF